ncbi:MAG: hypothetical protein U0T56_00795 [Ferruginibacter sp.]
MKKITIFAVCLIGILQTKAQHYSKLNWTSWDKAPKELKDQFKQVMSMADQTVYENISGNEEANISQNTGLKIFVSVFDVDNDGKKEYAVLSEMDRSLNMGNYHIVYYKDIGRKQVRVTARDLNFEFTDKGILFNGRNLSPFIEYSSIKKVKQTVDKPATKESPAGAADKLNAKAGLLFKGVKCKLSIFDKNSIADASNLTLNKAKTKFIEEGDDNYAVSAYPVDMNEDGIEEVFVIQSGGFMFGNAGSYFDLFMKLSDGKYKSVASVIGIPAITKTTANGYPELFVGGPGMSMPIWRFNGREYKFNRDGKGDFKYTDVEQASAAYQLAVASGKGVINPSKELAPDKENASAQTPVKQQSDPAITLTPLAAYLFRNSTTRLSNAEKNDITSLTELVFSDTSNLDKKGRPKKEFQVYPVDFDKNGTEEIFIRVRTRNLIGIEENMYGIYVKDRSGRYKAAPANLGMGAKVILKNAAGFCDIIARGRNVNGNLTVWRWNGIAYSVVSQITASQALGLAKKSIEDFSEEYQQPH